MRYVEVTTRSKIIKESITCRELRTLVASILRIESSGISMEFTISLGVVTTFVDFVDDEGAENFLSSMEKVVIYMWKKFS